MPSASLGFEEIAELVETRFLQGKRVLSFSEYLSLFQASPQRLARDASAYVRDVFDHYGTREVSYPWGTFRRFCLFDAPWEDEHGRQATLVGQEPIQEEIYRALCNFVREGRPSRVVLLHGPNGSAKSTAVGCVHRALEHYSTLDEGALYSFHWVFPSQTVTRGTLGFSGKSSASVESYAHLPDGELDAKLISEVREHPLFLIPKSERTRFLQTHFPDQKPNDWLLHGELSSKSSQVFDALLAMYKGSYREVLKHVQVVRYFISQRYRRGAVTLGPQMTADVAERQVTADRSLGSLPASLQALSLYETRGDLVDAAGGVLEFSDLLKRPLDAFKYLQLSVETQEVALTSQNVQLNCVMMGSANELHLDAFRQHPEFASFRGRLELIQTPYLLSFVEEQRIYDKLVKNNVNKRVAPFATQIAAMFAVLTRMRKPSGTHLQEPLRSLALGLSAWEKMRLYAEGKVPERLDSEARNLLRARIAELMQEPDEERPYEGRIGASPREIRTVLMDAAQSPKHASLSPLAVLQSLSLLSKRSAEFEWLLQEKQEGGYHDVPLMLVELKEFLLDAWQVAIFDASGLVDEQRYEELFERYVQNVSAWVKNERLHNRLTGRDDEADEGLMREVEALMGVTRENEAARRTMINEIAAFAIENPSAKMEPRVVFASRLAKMREAIFNSRLKGVADLCKDLIDCKRGDSASLDRERIAAAERLLSGMVAKGYPEDAALDAVAAYYSERLRAKV
jgi:serine protein kinase